MGIKGDLIAVGLAGAVLLAAGFYAKKKVSDMLDGPGQALSNFDNAVDSQLNGLGAILTGKPDWTYWPKPQDKYDLGGADMGILNPSAGWGDDSPIDKNFGVIGGW